MNDDDISENEFADLVAATQTTLAFWDNPFDDQDWNCIASEA